MIRRIQRFSSFGASLRYLRLSEIEDPAIADVATQVILNREPIPLGRIITLLSPRSKDRIFRSGKGVENFIRSGYPAVEIINTNGVKVVCSSVEPDGEVADELQGVVPAKPTSTPAAVKPVQASQTKPKKNKTTDGSIPVKDARLFRQPPPSVHNNWGGWGSSNSVPTEEDVYEVLKYVPVHWGNLGSMNIPAAVKKKHVRSNSFLQWLRRQPKFFEVRNIAGTHEIRRAVTLHPEEHGKTLEEAIEWLRERIASGEHNSVANTTADMGASSPAAIAIYKFLVRVTPGYFVSPELLFMRWTKKGMCVEDISLAAQEHPNVFEMLTLSTGDKLVRRKTGVDSSKWKKEFLADVESCPDDVKPLCALMGRSTCLWDRPQYLYVRLPEHEKILVGGFDKMVEVMKRHPQVFNVGVNFFKRINHSDPTTIDEPEPTGAEETPRQEEENVYIGHRDLAEVFHYVAPEGVNINATQLVDCASPAMKSVLPPRVITILQTFPDLFHCSETSPGVFVIRKVVKSAAGETTTLRAVEDEELTPQDVVQAVRSLIPARGVELSQLDGWMSMVLKRAVNLHFTSLSKLIDNHPQVFERDDHGVVRARGAAAHEGRGQAMNS